MFTCFYQGASNISLPFLAMAIVNEQGKVIVMPNLNYDLQTKRFIIAYLLTEYSKRKVIHVYILLTRYGLTNL